MFLSYVDSLFGNVGLGCDFQACWRMVVTLHEISRFVREGIREDELVSATPSHSPGITGAAHRLKGTPTRAAQEARWMAMPSATQKDEKR